MKIGIIGAENSHSIRIGEILNIKKMIKGVSVDYIWGETPKFAKTAAKQGNIPNIVKTPEQMLGKIDALIVDHRHGKYHLKPALPFIKAGIPAFIDKPFCYRLKEGKEFLKLARKYNTPVTSFSGWVHQRSYKNFVKKVHAMPRVLAASVFGPSDIHDKHGGVFFYGIHQLEMAVNAFGRNITSVLVTNKVNGATGQLLYTDGKIVTLNFIKSGYERSRFPIVAMGTRDTVYQLLTYDKEAYYPTTKAFVDMFKTGIEPVKHGDILKTISILEALERSVKSKKIEKVEPV